MSKRAVLVRAAWRLVLSCMCSLGHPGARTSNHLGTVPILTHFIAGLASEIVMSALELNDDTGFVQRLFEEGMSDGKAWARLRR